MLSISIRHLFRIRDCLAQLYAKDITPDDKQELDEALQREVSFNLQPIVCVTSRNFIFYACTLVLLCGQVQRTGIRVGILTSRIWFFEIG